MQWTLNVRWSSVVTSSWDKKIRSKPSTQDAPDRAMIADVVPVAAMLRWGGERRFRRSRSGLWLARTGIAVGDNLSIAVRLSKMGRFR
jgi:hypothetical protein